MYNIHELCDKLISTTNGSYNKIFEHSNYQNAFKPDVNDAVISLINKNTDLDKRKFTGIDICCGHGIMLQSLCRVYSDSKLIGIDIDKFNSWITNIDNLSYYTVDMFDLIRLDLSFKFDIIFTFNTLRGSITQWGHDNYRNFLQWCSKYSMYLITNNCTHRSLYGFELIDTMSIPGHYDINLFKSLDV